jgi:hypothetical protein
VDSPSPVPANISGLAGRLKVRAYPYPNQETCEADPAAGGYGGSPVECAVRDLPDVTEITDPANFPPRYVTDWKTNKKAGPALGRVPVDSYWQLVAFFDFDGDGWEDDEDLGSRIIKWTDTPSTDNPLGGWSLDINLGSNQPVPFVLTAGEDGCFGTAQAAGQVQCLIDFSQGGTLTLETGDNQAVIVEIGEGNDDGLQTVTGRPCQTAEGNPRNLHTDLPFDGTCTTWDVFPGLVAANGGPQLTDSYIFVCEGLTSPGDLGSWAIHMQDEAGTQALRPVTAVCGDFFTAAADLPAGLDALWRKLAGLFRAKELLATAAVKHGSPGAGLDGIGSDFQVLHTTAATYGDGSPGGTGAKAGSGSGSPPSQQLPVDGSTTLEVPLTDHGDRLKGDPQPVAGATVYFYSDANSTVSCVLEDTSCTDVPAADLPSTASAGVFVRSDLNGFARAVLTVQDQTAYAWALGCGIAVPVVQDGPNSQGLPNEADSYTDAGVAIPCDRDPDPALRAGRPNGPEAGTDPFMPRDATPTTAVYYNDLWIEYEAVICKSPDVDGIKGSDEPWSGSCIDDGFKDQFPVHLGGNLGGDGTAFVEWFIGPDPVTGEERIYFGIELEMDSDPSKVSLALEFDAGDGSGPGAPHEFDDQLELNRDKNSEDPSQGDIFDRYLTAACAGNQSVSVCNALDTDPDIGGQNDAEGAVQWTANPSGTGGELFFEISQKLNTGDVPVDLNLSSEDWVGFIVQIGVGNVRKGGTVFPEQPSGGKEYRSFQIP